MQFFAQVERGQKWQQCNDPSFYKIANCNTLLISLGPFLGKGSAGVAFQRGWGVGSGGQ